MAGKLKFIHQIPTPRAKSRTRRMITASLAQPFCRHDVAFNGDSASAEAELRSNSATAGLGLMPIYGSGVLVGESNICGVLFQHFLMRTLPNISHFDMAELAGLTLAVLDQLLKLTDRTIQFVSDARSFDETVRSLEDKIKDEHNRSDLLRILLFTPSPIYDSRAMFDLFTEDIKDQINIFLVGAVGKLQEGVDLLERRYIRHEADAKAETIEKPFGSSKVLDKIQRSSSTSLKVVQWSFRDKNRLETIVAEFTELNRRIHENVQLFVLCSRLGVNPQRHLKHLQESQTSRKLGFDVDATLKLHAENSEKSVEDCNLPEEPWEGILKAARPVDGLDRRFAITQDKASEENPRDLILEYRIYTNPVAAQNTHVGDSLNALVIDSKKAVEVDERTREFLNWLARLLKGHKEESFLILRCRGWRYVPSPNKIAFVFETPRGCVGSPISLFALLRDQKTKLSLNERVRIACGLARSLAQLQMVQWVHESIRSKNILFFSVPDESCPGKTRIDYTKPWVFGFEFSRPETFMSYGLSDVCIDRDVYRHPDRQGRPSVKFQKIHDIYALGVVMLEIGFWEPWDRLEKVKSVYHEKGGRSLQNLLMQLAARRLSRRMGDKYRDIVIKCLGNHFVMGEDTREELNLQQAFRAEVVDVLDKLLSSI